MGPIKKNLKKKEMRKNMRKQYKGETYKESLSHRVQKIMNMACFHGIKKQNKIPVSNRLGYSDQNFQQKQIIR